MLVTDLPSLAKVLCLEREDRLATNFKRKNCRIHQFYISAMQTKPTAATAATAPFRTVILPMRISVCSVSDAGLSWQKTDRKPGSVRRSRSNSRPLKTRRQWGEGYGNAVVRNSSS